PATKSWPCSSASTSRATPSCWSPTNTISPSMPTASSMCATAKWKRTNGSSKVGRASRPARFLHHPRCQYQKQCLVRTLQARTSHHHLLSFLHIDILVDAGVHIVRLARCDHRNPQAGVNAIDANRLAVLGHSRVANRELGQARGIRFGVENPG